MGCCCSTNSEDIYEDSRVNDRTNLLGNPVGENSRAVSINRTERISSLTGRVDEQAKLNKILQNTANSYIDVPALNSPTENLNYHGLEKSYGERIRQIVTKNQYEVPEVPLLIDHEQVEQVLSCSPLSPTDRKMVNECSSQVLAATKSFRVDFPQSIIIPFSGHST